MQNMIQYFKTSRISEINLSNCNLNISSNQRQFALYFEMEEENVAKSLWSEIHEEKIISSTVHHLNLSGFQMSINQKKLLLHQEISVIEATNLQILNISKRAKAIEERCKDSIHHLLHVIENLPKCISISLEKLVLESFCFHQSIPCSEVQDLKNVLGSYRTLTGISFSSCWFYKGRVGDNVSFISVLLVAIP